MAAKKQYKGQLAMARENIENRIIGMSRGLLLHGRLLSVSESDELIDNVTAEQMSETLSRFMPLSSLTLMP